MFSVAYNSDVPKLDRVAIIGDVGGHFAELFNVLCELGLDPETNLLPEGLQIVQVGDLIHRGPDSDTVVTFVDQLLQANGSRWVQLAGNHEAQYLFPPRFQWRQTVAAETEATLRRWWSEGAMVLAAALPTTGVPVRRPGGLHELIGGDGLLVTHAGLTLGCWDALGNPNTAQAAAEAINSLRFTPYSAVWQTGHMLEQRIRFDAGPVWAEPTAELYLPWIRASHADPLDGGCLTPGFSQAHGHASAFRWDVGRWSRTDLQALFTPISHIDAQQRHLRIEAGRQVLWGVDPGHGITPAPRWGPLMFNL